MAIKRGVVFRIGDVGLTCAAFEVSIEAGTEDRRGSMRPVRDCVNAVTVVLRAKDGSLTGLCDDCADAALARPDLGLTELLP
jgi:hypothetical protein